MASTNDIVKLRKLLKDRRNIYDTTNNYDSTLAVEINIERANLGGAILMRANLGGAILIGADLSGAILIGADLSGAILTKAILTKASLFNAKLTCADLSGADLTDATLIDADLSGAILTKAILTDASLFHANLTGADLSGALLGVANLRGANLTDANLRGAILTDADLDGADLTDADLTDAILTGATLRGTILTGAILTGATLIGTAIGRAHEIHSAFDDFEPKIASFLDIINAKDNTNIYNSNSIYQYIYDVFSKNINRLFPEQQEKKDMFETVFRKIDGYIHDRYIELVGKSIHFAFSQNDDFIKQYIISFLDDNCNAYDTGDKTSCVKGIIERFVLTIGVVVEIFCKEGCDNEVYQQLYHLIMGKMHSLTAMKLWFENAEKNENIQKMTTPQKKLIL